MTQWICIVRAYPGSNISRRRVVRPAFRSKEQAGLALMKMYREWETQRQHLLGGCFTREATLAVCEEWLSLSHPGVLVSSLTPRTLQPLTFLDDDKVVFARSLSVWGGSLVESYERQEVEERASQEIRNRRLLG